ncbi:MAG: glycosyl hydrolase family 18 protein [Clostridia bacterium]|nr:glycosyl hydrolase family 18 protein [Clostridia bacterium]
MEIYTVKQGDTLSSIAASYGITPEIIINTNLITNPDNLVVGQDLLILIPQISHTVTEGETLASIADEYNVSVASILRNNPTITSDNLPIGTNLAITYRGVSPTKTITLNAYTYPEISREKLIRILPYLTFMTIFTYGFTNNGDLIAPNDEELIQLALDFGVAPTMLISTLTSEGTFSNELARTLLNDPDLQSVLINNLINTMKEKGYTALDIDFEYLPVENRESYINFVTQLTEELNANGFYSLVSLAPKTSSTQPGLLYESHDYFGLGNAANFALLMTYEWGYTYGPPLPVSPLPNVEAVISYGVSEIPPDKILMGIPLYGYDWELPYVKGTKARSLSPVQAVELALSTNSQIEYDDYQQAPFFYYTENGRQHIVWFENLRSIDAKFNLIDNYSLAGAGLWNLVRDFPQFYMLLNSRFYINKLI